MENFSRALRFVFGQKQYAWTLIVGGALAASGCMDDVSSPRDTAVADSAVTTAVSSGSATDTTSSSSSTPSSGAVTTGDSSTAATGAATTTAGSTSSTNTNTTSTNTGTTSTNTSTTSTSTTANVAPVIAGTPTKAINAGQAYSFAPSASDANGDTIAFSIQNKPSWASFDTTTGRLSGTPTAANVGTYSNVVISVSDATHTTSLAAFAINVTAISTGSATLSWTPPTQNTDGTTLTNLSGYKIYYGTSASAMTQVITISNTGVVQYVVDNLSPATWYFAVKAVSANGVESDFSATVSKTI